MSRMNTYCNGVTPHPQCPGCDYCLGSEGGPARRGYEWVQERRQDAPPVWPAAAGRYDPDDPATHPLDCMCLYCIPGA